MARSPAVRRAGARVEGSVRRGLILEAAREVFVDCGYAGARVQRIAREADVAEAVLYRHFPSKAALFEAAVLEPLERMVNDLVDQTAAMAELTDREDCRSGFAAMHATVCRACVELVPLLGVALFSEGGRRFYCDRLVPLLDRGHDSAATLLDSWPLRRPLDPATAFTATFGMYLGVALDAFMRGEVVDADTVSATLADMVVRGVSGPRAGRGSGPGPADQTWPPDPPSTERATPLT